MIKVDELSYRDRIQYCVPQKIRRMSISMEIEKYMKFFVSIVFPVIVIPLFCTTSRI